MATNRDNGPSDSTGMLGSIVGVLLLLYVAIYLAGALASALPPYLLLAVLVGGIVVAGRRLAGGRGHGSLGGLFGAPRPLGGSARWAGFWDLSRAGWIGRGGAAGGWPIGVYHALGGLVPITVRLPLAAQPQSVLIVAPNGAGKTDGPLVQMARAEATIADPAQRHSAVLLDPKGDVLEKARDALEQTHKILIWDPSHPERSTVAFDPLAWLPDVRDPWFQAAGEAASSCFLAATQRMSRLPGSGGGQEGDYWLRNAQMFLTGVLLYRRAAGPITWLDIVRYLRERPLPDIGRDLLHNPGCTAIRIAGMSLKELLLNERARGIVGNDILQRMMLLADPRLKTALAPGKLPAFDLKSFLAHPTILQLRIGAINDPLAPLLSVVVATLSVELLRRAENGKPLPRGVRFFCDEVGVIGPIYTLDAAPAITRSANIGWIIVAQTLAQLRSNYGREAAETLLANLNHRIVLGGATDEDARWVCGNLGRQEAYRELPSTNGRGEQSRHYAREEWPLLRPDQLRRMRFEAVVDSPHIPPLRVTLRRYDGKPWRR